MAIGPPTKTGATTQSRSTNPGQGADETAPGRRPLRGVTQALLSSDPVSFSAHVWPVSWTQYPDAHASNRNFNGPGPPVIAAGRCLRCPNAASARCRSPSTRCYRTRELESKKIGLPAGVNGGGENRSTACGVAWAECIKMMGALANGRLAADRVRHGRLSGMPED